MRSVNYSLRKAYFAALTGFTFDSNPVPVYYLQAPDNVTDSNYIVFSGLSSNDVSSKHKADTQTSIRVTIHTFNGKANSGEAADALANDVLQAIYPNSTFNLDLSADNFQIVTTKLDGDYTQDYTILTNRVYVDRILTFTHRIFHQ